MGTTEKLLKSHFFLTDVGDPFLELAPTCLKLPKEVFQGYYGKYFYKPYGVLETYANTIDGDVEDELVGMSFGVSGNHNTFLEVKGHYIKKFDDLEEVVLVDRLDDKNGGEFPICLINADVLPWFDPGTIVYGQMAAYAITMELFDSREKCLDSFSKTVRDAMDGSEGHILMENHDGAEISSVWGKIVHRAMLPVNRKIRGVQHPGLPYFELDTTLGRLGLVIPSSKMFEPSFIEKLNQPDAYVYTRFVLALDVAIGEYQNGAIFDERHLLQVLGNSLSSGNVRRLCRNLAENCVLSGNETVEGAKNIEKYLLEIAEEQHKAGFSQSTFLGIVDKTGDGALFPEGKECLILVDSALREVYGFAFITLDKYNRIDWIEFCYDLGAYRVKMVSPRSQKNFGVVFDQTGFVSLKSDKEWASILASWSRGEEVDTTEIYASLNENAVFFAPGDRMEGRDNVWYCLQEEFGTNLGIKEQLEVKGNTLIRRGLGFDDVYTICTDKAGRIQSIEKGYAKKEEVKPEVKKETVEDKAQEELLDSLAEALGDLDDLRIGDFLAEDFTFDSDEGMMNFNKETFLEFLEMVFQRFRETGAIEVVKTKDPYAATNMLVLKNPGEEDRSIRILVKDDKIIRMELGRL